MSYCRWSSDNWKCDIYCYEDVDGGYTTHVAAARFVGDIPQEPEIGDKDWLEKHNIVMDWLDAAKKEPIGLEYDGENFNDPDLDNFMATLTMLKDTGYNVPDYVFDMIKEEMEAA